MTLKAIREKGFNWFWNGLKKEFRSPTKNYTKFIAVRMEKFRALVRAKLRKRNNNAIVEGRLIAIYDLNNSAITFDFAFFLAAAEAFAKRNGRDELFIYFVPQKDTASIDEIYDGVINVDSRVWRFNNIVLPIISLHKLSVGFSVLPKNEPVPLDFSNVIVYPEGYSSTYSPRMEYKEIMALLSMSDFDGYSAPLQGLSYIKQWKNGSDITRPIVCITLRQYGYDQARNSNIESWTIFAKWVSSIGFHPVFVPDTDSCWVGDSLLKEFMVFSEAAWNIGLRLALYEASYVNFFYSNGVSAIAQLDRKVSCICMYPDLEESLQARGSVYDDWSLKEGRRSFQFSTPHQYLSWKTDTLDNIKNEFISFMEGNQPLN